MRTQHWQHFEQAHLHQVLPAEKRAFETRLHGCELGAILIEETAKTRRIRWRERGNLILHCSNVGSAVEFAACAELNTVLRIEPHHFHFVAQACARNLKNLLEHAGIEEEGRAEVECESIRLDAGSASADDGQAFNNFHAHSGSSQKDRRGEAARAGADNENLFSHG